VPGNKKISISDEAPSWYHPGRSGKIILNKKIEIGYFGELHPRIANKFKIKARVNLFELMIDNVPLIEKKTTNKPQLILSDFQSVTRDFAFILDKDVKSSDLIKAALNVDTKIIKSAEIFDLFEDKSLGDDKKSMAIKVVLQSEEKTLDENDINSLSSKIVEAIEKSTSGTVRS
jgi:phenylalanyl-tRNA synthetase beta chain